MDSGTIVILFILGVIAFYYLFYDHGNVSQAAKDTNDTINELKNAVDILSEALNEAEKDIEILKNTVAKNDNK